MPKPQIDKVSLRAQLLALLDETREGVALAQRAVQEGATHAEARSEGSKDMRSTEASYIARGQAMRVGALDQERARVATMELRAFGADDAIGLSALVIVAVGSRRRHLFIAPAGGGLTLKNGAQSIQVVTPPSPLGLALVGARAGASLVVERNGEDEEVDVIAVT